MGGFGVSWNNLATVLGCLGPSWHHMSISAHLAIILDIYILGPSWAIFGQLWTILEPSWDILEAPEEFWRRLGQGFGRVSRGVWRVDWKVWSQALEGGLEGGFFQGGP